MSTRSEVAVFFAASIVLTALCQAPGVLAMRGGAMPGGAVLLLMAVGSSGPTLVAVALSAASGGRAGVRSLFARRGAPGPGLHAIALLHVLAAHLVGTALLMVAGAYSARHLLYPPLRPEQLAIAIVAPLGEEYGWRGYALPRLQSVTTPLRASLLIGAVWAVWHLPTFFVPGASLVDLFRMLPLLLAGSVLYTWVYNASGASMRLMVLCHLGAHLDNVYRASASGDGYAPLYSTTLVLATFAVVLVAQGRLASPRTAATS